MSPRPPALRARLPLAAALLLALPALATTMLRLDLDSLSQGADAVVRGRVLGVHSRWSGDGRRIVTDVEVEVAETLKGAPGARLTLTQPGGVVGDIGQSVQGVAAFAAGEEVVLFLERKAADRFALRGLAQGKFRVERAADGSAWAVPEALGEAGLVDPTTRAPTATALSRMRLDALRSGVRRALAAPQKAPGEQR